MSESLSLHRLGRQAGQRWAQLAVSLLTERLERCGVSEIQVRAGDSSYMRLGVPRELAEASSHDQVPVPRITLNRFRAVRRGIKGGLLGWAESYIDDEWQCDDLRSLMQWAMTNEKALEKAFQPGSIRRVWDRIAHRLNDNTKRGSKRNIAFHYDLGNDFYSRWLDKTMTYSSALFSHEEEDLETAQLNKYDALIDAMKLIPGDRVLEIGCGWGGMGERLLSREPEASWHGITLSREQLAYTERRLAHFGDKAKATYTDYRDLDGTFDAIVSIEMLEAVGEANWPTYFQQLHERLIPGGRAAIQVITIADDRFESYREGADFIQRYIFPGGMLPSPQKMEEQIDAAGLKLVEQRSFGRDYARTLNRWHQAFNSQWSSIEAQGFDERFRRLWNYYLCYCEAGFNAGSIDVRFYIIER
ncbi:class I SAM-dependent methyltransferase [Pokkaliibacter sp. CJK22405]|uniref:class I SAM-dependent methyltransferase n=1 Tax=Pokkaliibacter sp. CJK22405 TaxID=3384615 RepID=UPI0039847698